MRAADGQIRHEPSGRAIGFGELTEGQRLTQEYGDDAPVTPAAQWTVAGTSAPNVEGQAIVTGQRRYTPDMTRPGMLFGRVLRPPSFGATLTALDASAAEALPGVTVVHDGDLVGVVAPSRLAAARALDAEVSRTAASEAARKRAVIAALDAVASRLGNTRAVCRKCYVHPCVADHFLAGRTLSAAGARLRGVAGLERDERALLALLDLAARSATAAKAAA